MFHEHDRAISMDNDICATTIRSAVICDQPALRRCYCYDAAGCCGTRTESSANLD